MMREILTSIKRAGADLILTYHAKDFAAAGLKDPFPSGAGLW